MTIITGAGQGLGAAAAKLFAQHGAKLVVTDLDGSKAEQVRQACSYLQACVSSSKDVGMTCSLAYQVAQEIQSQGGEAIAIAGDVTAADFPQRCIEATVQRFGTLDILINNAGAHSCLTAFHYMLPCLTPSSRAAEECDSVLASCRLHMGRYDPQDYIKAVGCHAGCALHSTLQADPGNHKPPPCCTPGSDSMQCTVCLRGVQPGLFEGCRDDDPVHAGSCACDEGRC